MQDGYLARILSAMAKDGWFSPPHTTGQAADEFVRRVDLKAEDGEIEAVVHLSRWKHEGSRRDLNKFVKSERVSYWVSHEGLPIGGPKEVTLRPAVPTRREDGTRDGSFQRPLFWALSWEELEDLLDRRVRLQAAINVSVEFARQVLALRVKYPEATTPLEACELEGLDIGNLNFEVAQ